MIKLPENPYKPVLNDTDEIWANIVDVRDRDMLKWFVEWGEGDCSHQPRAGRLRRQCYKCWQEPQDKLAEMEGKK